MIHCRFCALGNIPALCCAPNAPVAACLELILNAMLELNLKDVSL
jgi:hypothetical protein